MSPTRIAAAIGVFLLLSSFLYSQQSSEEFPGDWYISAVNTPRDLVSAAEDPVVVAVVDDGVRTTHESLSGYIWNNPREKAGNRIDDDGNGRIDDVHGWDITDRDGDAAPPPGRAADFYHGTLLASLIVGVVETAYGDAATELVKIMPVKCTGDLAVDFYLRDGYTGLEYAVEAGADIILCAWGSGRIEPQELLILQKAADRGILLVASGGNLPEEREQYPAAFAPALAVAAHGRDGNKIENSTYGSFIDLMAPGMDIRGASAVSDTAYQVKEGSSFAAAITAGAAAVVKLQYPSYSWPEVSATLKSTAEADETVNEDFSARLGAGNLDLGNAVRNPLYRYKTPNGVTIRRPQGFLRVGDVEQGTITWGIEPPGEVNGIRFYRFPSRNQASAGQLSFFTGGPEEANIVERFSLDEFPESVYVAGPVAAVVFEADNDREGEDLIIEYKAEPLDLRTFYCEGTKKIDLEGSFEDGSGADNYANNSDCKWLITAPPGKVVRFVFDEFETEPVFDKLYFFNGTGTHEEIMAIFSGSHPPREFVSWTNQVLVWFITDGKNRFGGWRANFTFVDP